MAWCRKCARMWGRCKDDDVTCMQMRPKRSPRAANSELRAMAVADNYVMVRHPGCIPFVLGIKEWKALPDYNLPKTSEN